MGMPFFDNVNYSGKKPLDSRAGYDTVANMVAATKVYDGLMAYVTATKKYYTYDSANEADPTLGKWREFEGGGSGASNLSDLGDVLIDDETLEGGQHLEYNEDSGRWVNGVSTLDKQTDVNITNPSNGDVLQYNSTSGKWENKSGENVIINGYAYTPPLQTVQDYIDAANAHFGKTLSFANPSILDGKTVGSIILAYAPTKAYIIFSEGKISLTPYNLKRSGHYYMESSRWATDGSNISGYNITPTAYETPVSTLNSITIKGTSEIDINAYDMPDENHEGWFYYSENATLDGTYFGQTKELVETLYFYSDQAHTQKITPESGKFYVDIPSGDMYEWRDGEYKKVGGSVSGHTIEDSEGTALTQRDTLQFGDGLNVSDDSTNGKTVVEPNLMVASDMDDVVTPLPGTKPSGIIYSTTEKKIGKWIDGADLYERTFTQNLEASSGTEYAGVYAIANVDISNLGISKIVYMECPVLDSLNATIMFPNCGNEGLFRTVIAQPNSNRISIRSSNANDVGKTAYVTARYTKTT